MAKYTYVRKTMTFAGKRYEVRGKTEAEAREKLNLLRQTLIRGDIFSSGSVSVNQWYKKWVNTYKASSGITPKSLHLYDEKYNKYLRPVIGRLPLKDIRDFHLQEILNNQIGMSFSHVSKLRMVMQEMFRQAKRSRLLVYDPSEDLILPDSVKRPHRPITELERTHILAVAAEHYAGLWVLTLLYAGLRPGETAALIWEDIDFVRNEIHVNKSLESGSNRIKEPKTSAGVRDIPMRRELREQLWLVRDIPQLPVFLNKMGRRHNHSSLYRMWASFVRAVDLHMGAVVEDGKITQHAIAPDLTPYCLRHSFCTDLQRAGVPINVAKELMGHSDISITANIYTHRDQLVLHENIAKLDRIR